MTAKTNRQKVYDLIKTNKQATAQEIANWYKVPIATVRFHLRILVDEGRVQAVRTQRVHSLGKPRIIYQIMDLSKEDRYRVMLDRVILASELDEKLRENLFNELLAQFGSPTEARTSSLTMILIELIEKLEKFGYDARWEVRRNSPRVLLRSCPYANSICRESFFCEMDRKLISINTGREVKTIKTMSENSGSSCSFEII